MISMYITCFTVLESEKNMIPFKKKTLMVDFDNILLGKIVFLRIYQHKFWEVLFFEIYKNVAGDRQPCSRRNLRSPVLVENTV